MIETKKTKDDRAGVVLAVSDFLFSNGRRKYKSAKKKRNETGNLFVDKQR